MVNPGTLKGFSRKLCGKMKSNQENQTMAATKKTTRKKTAAQGKGKAKGKAKAKSSAKQAAKRASSKPSGKTSTGIVYSDVLHEALAKRLGRL